SRMVPGEDAFKHLGRKLVVEGTVQCVDQAVTGAVCIEQGSVLGKNLRYPANCRSHNCSTKCGAQQCNTRVQRGQVGRYYDIAGVEKQLDPLVAHIAGENPNILTF